MGHVGKQLLELDVCLRGPKSLVLGLGATSEPLLSKSNPGTGGSAGV